MSRLQELHDRVGQSPWMDELSRADLVDLVLRRRVREGVRGLTTNPTIVARALGAGGAYDGQIEHLARAGVPPEEMYWELICRDVSDACAELAAVHDSSGGDDGYVSVEINPYLAGSCGGTIDAALALSARIDRPNVLVKLPATDAGIDAIPALVSRGCNLNVTLIFDVDRYAAVADAYLTGLERHPDELSSVFGVASFFVSRIDVEVNRRLGAPDGLTPWLHNQAALAEAARLVRHSEEIARSARWAALAARGARPQKVLFASTSVKDPHLPPLYYAERLAIRDTVITMEPAALDAYSASGARVRPTEPSDPDALIDLLRSRDVDLRRIGRQLESAGAERFQASYDQAIALLKLRSRVA